MSGDRALAHLVRASFGEFLVRADARGALLSVSPLPPGEGGDASDAFPAGSRAEAALQALRTYLDSPWTLDAREWAQEPCLRSGSPFEQEVWRALAGIRCGSTVTYGSLAARLGRPRAARAVARFNREVRRSALVRTEILEQSNGDYLAVMSLDDELGRLMTLELTATSSRQAMALNKAFEAKADKIFQLVIGQLTAREPAPETAAADEGSGK